MRPGVAADRMTSGSHLPEDFGRPHRMLADREEDRLGAVGSERRQDGGRVVGPRTIVEGQHNLAGLQKIVVA